jgi:hypothetical protein
MILKKLFKKKENYRYSCYIALPNNSLGYLKHILRKLIDHFTISEDKQSKMHVYQFKLNDVDNIIHNAELREYLNNFGDSYSMLIHDSLEKKTYLAGNKQVLVNIVKK